MSLPQSIDDFLPLQASLLYQGYQVVRVIHLTVSVGNSREIEADLRQTERSRLEALTVPKGLHDVKSTVIVHHTRSPTQYTRYLLLTEAIFKL